MVDGEDQPAPSAGRGRGNGGGRGRGGPGRGAGRGYQGRRSSSGSTPEAKFKGSNDKLSGSVFDYGGTGNQDGYVKSMKAVVNYIGQEFSNPRDIQTTVEDSQIYVIPMPTEPPGYGTDAADKTQSLIFEKKIARYIIREETLQDNLAKTFSLIWGQCTDSLKAKLESVPDWKRIHREKDALTLIKEVKNIIYKFEDQSYPMHSLFRANETVYLIKQREDESNVRYYERFCNMIEAAEQYGASFGIDKVCYLTDDTYKSLSDTAKKQEENIKEAQARTRERYLAYAFIYRLDYNRYQGMKKELMNDYAKGKDNYPTTVLDAYNLIVNYKYDRRQRPATSNDTEGLSFNQQGETSGNRFRNVTCYNCGEKGHIAPNCTKKQRDTTNNTNGEETSGEEEKTATKQEKTVFFQDDVDEEDELQFCTVDQLETSESDSTGEFCFVDVNETHIAFASKNKLDLRNVLLLDNQSTTDLFCNEKILHNIREVAGKCTVVTNGGTIETRLKGTLKGYGEVWYHPGAITNILSLSNVKKKYKITFNSEDGDCFFVHKPEKIIKFRCSENGLYIHNIKNKQDVIMVNTVAENESAYTDRQVAQAKRARKLYGIVGYPSIKDFKAMIEGNLIMNCPVTIDDVNAAEKIYGASIAAIKGKTTRQKPVPVKSDYIKVPEELIARNKILTLTADLMFVNKIPFLVTLSRTIRFSTIEVVKDRKMTTLVKAIGNVLALYRSRKFVIKEMLMDPEFDPLGVPLQNQGVRLNTTSANEHVPEIERHIRVIKERARAKTSRLPFKKLPRVIIKEMVKDIITWLNNFPVKGGVSKTMSPRTIMSGLKFDYNRHCKVELGAYVQTHDEPSPSNSMKERTTGAIALRCVNNVQGGYIFMSLNTGKILKRRRFTILPMPNDVIARVEQMATAEGAEEEIRFGDRHGDDVPGMDHDEATEAPEIVENDELPEIEESDEEIVVEAEEDLDIEIPEAEDAPAREEQPAPLAPMPREERAEEAVYRTRSGRASNPPSRYIPSMGGKSYEGATLLNASETKEYGVQFAQIIHVVMNHMTLKQGIKQFGKKGSDAAFEEMNQLHKREVFKPLNVSSMTEEEKRQAIGSLIFLKEKRDGTIKGRACADGRKQRETMAKEEASSPTPALEAVLLTAVIEAKEKRDVAVMDIPNAFVQTDMEGEEKVVMKIRGQLAELLVRTDPKIYRKFITMERGQTVLYLELRKALYGMLKSALLFYKKLVKDLESIGFKINPYDACVANRMINGHQQTMVWHVDDLKSSHVDPKVNDEFISWIKSKYEEDGIGKLEASRGKIHNYLGMTLDYSTEGKVKIKMEDYVQSMVDDFSEELGTPAVTPVAEHLFQVRDSSTKLSEGKATEFHNQVARGLFLCKRSRPDIQVAIAFLSTRVREPDEDDWKKLIRLLRYMKGTVGLSLILEANETNIFKWWIDASFAVHPEMRSHTGGTFSLGRGCITSKSSKQKINSKSSTEAELIAVDDLMSAVIWTNEFMKEQGYDVKDCLVYQDNKSAILLEKNGKASSGKRTKHLNVRYFFIKDRSDNGELKIEYCPTDDMVADYFTKPLQGNKFIKFRKEIMGI